MLYNCIYVRSLRGDKLLLAVAGIGRLTLRSADRATLSISSSSTAMGLRGYRLPINRLSRSYSLVGIRLHVHVDVCGSIPRYQVTDISTMCTL